MAQCKRTHSQSYRLSPAANRAISRFQNAHNSKARRAVVKRILIFFNAFHEIGGFRPKRFYLLDLRAPTYLPNGN